MAEEEEVISPRQHAFNTLKQITIQMHEELGFDMTGVTLSVTEDDGTEIDIITFKRGVALDTETK